MLREKTRRRRNSFSEGVENCGEPVTGLVLELRSVEVLRATKGGGQDDTGDSEDSVTRDMQVSPVSSVEVMLRASPLGFGLPRPLTFVALPYRLSSIVVPGEARNLLFPHFMCRKKSEEARAFPGVAANGSPLSTHIVNATRESAFPLSIRSYASFTFSSGYFSTIAFTPVSTANRSVSSASVLAGA